MNETIIRCSAGMGNPISGVALSASDDFSARYDLDRIRGVFSRPSHKLYGESYVGKILVLNTAKGGVATAWMLLDMVSRGLAPAALILNRANPIMVQGAAFAELTLMHGFDVDIPTQVETGELIRVDPVAKHLIKNHC
ncbi:MAG: DUF126 domain-containing protein [Acidiferrobacterales bacterium]|nr:DUF126 domain-containing protein [Acidiferrobacterales bacterium]